MAHFCCDPPHGVISLQAKNNLKPMPYSLCGLRNSPPSPLCSSPISWTLGSQKSLPKGPLVCLLNPNRFLPQVFLPVGAGTLLICVPCHLEKMAKKQPLSKLGRLMSVMREAAGVHYLQSKAWAGVMWAQRDSHSQLAQPCHARS